MKLHSPAVERSHSTTLCIIFLQHFRKTLSRVGFYKILFCKNTCLKRQPAREIKFICSLASWTELTEHVWGYAEKSRAARRYLLEYTLDHAVRGHAPLDQERYVERAYLYNVVVVVLLRRAESLRTISQMRHTVAFLGKYFYKKKKFIKIDAGQGFPEML